MRRLLLVAACLAAVAAGASAGAAALRAGDAADAVRRVPEAVREAPARAAERVRGAGVPQVRCPAAARAEGCREVRGRVVFVESVDPDGDGDLHVVVAGESITGPGVTSIDVRPSLRPARDPRVGDVVSAAGPVQRGSFGQAQVHALRFRAAR